MLLPQLSPPSCHCVQPACFYFIVYPVQFQLCWMYHRSILEVSGFNFMANPGLVLSLLGGWLFILHSTVTGVIRPRRAEAFPMVHQRSESSGASGWVSKS